MVNNQNQDQRPSIIRVLATILRVAVESTETNFRIVDRINQEIFSIAIRWSRYVNERLWIYFPSWSSLRSAQSRLIVRTSFIWLVSVPLCGKIFEKVSNKFPITILGREIELILELPFSVKVLYIASLCFGAALIVFQVRCVEFVNNYRDYRNFQEKSDSGWMLYNAMKHQARITQSVDDLLSFLKRFGTELIPQTEEPISVRGQLINGEKILDESFSLKEDVLPDAFAFVHDCNDKCRGISRLACTMLFFFGYIMAGWITFQSAIFVFKQFT